MKPTYKTYRLKMFCFHVAVTSIFFNTGEEGQSPHNAASDHSSELSEARQTEQPMSGSPDCPVTLVDSEMGKFNLKLNSTPCI